jgi:hypothetical protein
MEDAIENQNSKLYFPFLSQAVIPISFLSPILSLNHLSLFLSEPVNMRI